MHTSYQQPVIMLDIFHSFFFPTLNLNHINLVAEAKMIISINDSTWTGSEAFLSAAGEARYESRSWRSVSREAGVGMLFCGKRRPVLGISSEMQHDNKR